MWIGSGGTSECARLPASDGDRTPEEVALGRFFAAEFMMRGVFKCASLRSTVER